MSEANDSIEPLLADGFAIKDRQGNPLGSTSRKKLTLALVVAYNHVNGHDPICDVCQCQTVLSRQCFKCPNCGNSMGVA